MEVRLLSKAGAGCSGKSLAFCPVASLGESPCVCGVAWGLGVQPEQGKGAGLGRRMELPAPVPAQDWPCSTPSPVGRLGRSGRVWAEESCPWPPAGGMPRARMKLSLCTAGLVELSTSCSSRARSSGREPRLLPAPQGQHLRVTFQPGCRRLLPAERRWEEQRH